VGARGLTDPATGEKWHGYKEDGYFPEAFINMLALLGWNPGTDQEIFSLQELCELFTLDRVKKSGAKFDPEKTKWFNHKYEREGYLFQDRFKSEVIEDQGYLLRCFRYVLQNPLKAGLCHEISEYRWNSYSVYFNPVDSFVSTEFLTLFFDSKADFQAYMLEDEDGEFMEAGYQFKDHEVRKLLEEMLEGKSFEILTKVEQRQVLKVLKQNPNIGLRQLARITGISLGIIHRL